MRFIVPESLRRRPWLGFAGSLALHLFLIASLLWVHPPSSRFDVKRGEPLFVELAKADEEAMRGLPGSPVEEPSAPAPPAAKPAPPAPKAAPPAPKPEQPASKPVPRAPKTARARPPVPKRPPVVAKVPPPPPVVAKAPAPAPPPPPKEETIPEPVPAKPAPPVEEPAPAAAPAPSVSAARPAPPQPAPAPATPAAPPRVASATVPQQTAPDIRAALGRGGQGGAGGTGEGRAGIEGEPIPLDTRDPRYSDYLDRVRRMIKAKWAYPCVRDPGSGRCDYKSTQLVVEFGILKEGPVAFVIVRKQSGFDIYDEYAVNAIKLASPFPPVPDSLTKGSKGIPILVTFSYIVESSLTNLLR